MLRELHANAYDRPYPLDSMGSRPLSHRQTSDSWSSSRVGDDQRMPGVVCLIELFALWVLGFGIAHV